MRLSGSRAYYRPSPPKMPPGLVELMEGLTKEVLKQSPTDVYGFCANHMQQLLEKRDGPFPKKSLSLEEKVAKAQEKVRQKAKIRREEYDKAFLQQQQQNNNAADGATLQVPQLVKAQIPQSVSADCDKDKVKENISNKPVHHEHALERSAEMEISHQLGSAICKPIITPISAESIEEKTMKKNNDLEETKPDAEIVKVDNSKKSENMVTEEFGSKPINMLQNVSLNINPETKNKQTLSNGKTSLDVAFESNILIDQFKENADQQIESVDLKGSAKEEYIASVEKDKDRVDITLQNSAVENAVETTKSLNNGDVNLLNSNVSDGFQIETQGKTDTTTDIQVSNDIQQIPRKYEEQTQQPNIADVVIHAEENIKTSSITDLQQFSTIPNPEINSANDKLNTGSIKDIKLPNTIADKPQGNEIIEIQPRNNPNTVQEANSDKGGFKQIKSDEKAQHQNNMPPTEVSNLKIEDAQLPKNSENNKLLSTVTDLVQESYNSDTQRANNLNIIQKENSDKGNTLIKSDENNQQLNNTTSDTQCANNPNIIQKETSDKGNTLIKSDEKDQQLNNTTSDTRRANNPNIIQKENSDKGNTLIKSDEKVEQLNNTTSTEVARVKIEDAQLSSESNKPKDDGNFDNFENLIKPIEETKVTVVSEPESRTDLPVTSVDSDILTMVTENLPNNDDNGLKSKTLVNKEIRQHDDKDNADLGKVISDSHTRQNAEVHSSDSNADFSIPSHSTEDDDTSHDEASANMSDKAQKDNQDASTMDLETAAITIQKVFRNFLFKSRGSTFEDSANDEGNSLDEDDKNKEECQFPIASALNIDRRAHGITRMDTVLQTVNEEKSLSLSTDDSSTLSSAATIIQAHVRGFLVRNKLNSNKTISTNSLAASNSNEPSITSLEADNDHNKNKTILNIHIVPEGENCFSRDESLITSMDLSLDSSPPSSINLHPLGYDKSERRKQLKREDAIQSVSPPSNNSGKLSEDLDSVKELSLNDHDIVEKQLEDHDNNIIKDDLTKEDRMVSPIHNGSLETDVETNDNNIPNNTDDSETRLKQKRKSLTKMSSDEMDVVTPYISNEDSASSNLIHSGEFHDGVLPTRVSRSDTSVVSGE